MNDFFTQMISSILASTLITGALTFIFRAWISERLKGSIQHEYNQKLETHKVVLKAETERELTSLKAALQIAAKEHEVRFSKLHETRFEVIARTFELINAIKTATDPPPDAGVVADEVIGLTAQRFHAYYPGKIIYFPKKTASLLLEVDLQIQKYLTLAHAKRMAALFDKDSDIRVLLNKTMEAIEADFRKLLGEVTPI